MVEWRKHVLLAGLAAFLSVFAVGWVDPGLDSARQAGPITSTVTYAPSNAVIANPERGLYRYIATRASKPEAYDLDELRGFRTNQNITLLYCITYLDTFVDAPISEAFLKHIETNLVTVRQAGLKCILRFAYTDDDPTERNEKPPFGDASKDRIMAHIQQLKPLLRDNADVIAVLQAGFIGVWGEWYYTDDFVDDPNKPGIISPAQHAKRLEVLEALLDALPSSRTVAVRYPHGKQAMLKSDTPLTENDAFADTTTARTGFHNDCFLADDTDYGTYRDDPQSLLQADKAYTAAETKFVSMGGETCNVNPPRSLCPTATAEMALFHWTYANREYHPKVYQSWVDGGCIDDIQRRLGYRLTLNQGTFGDAVRPGDGFSIRLALENQGYAAPINLRPVRLLLRHEGGGKVYTATVADDVRRWLPGQTHTLEWTVGIHPNMPSGKYALLLHLPDDNAALAPRPEYALRIASEDVWESATGYNDLLHTVTVDASAPPTPYSGMLYFTGGDLPPVGSDILYLPQIQG